MKIRNTSSRPLMVGHEIYPARTTSDVTPQVAKVLESNPNFKLVPDKPTEPEHDERPAKAGKKA